MSSVHSGRNRPPFRLRIWSFWASTCLRPRIGCHDRISAYRWWVRHSFRAQMGTSSTILPISGSSPGGSLLPVRGHHHRDRHAPHGWWRGWLCPNCLLREADWHRSACSYSHKAHSYRRSLAILYNLLVVLEWKYSPSPPSRWGRHECRSDNLCVL